MPAPQQSFPVPLPTLGVRYDVLPEAVPPQGLVDAQNWILRDGAARLRNGLAVFGATTSARPQGYISYVHNDGVTRLVKATTAKWFKYSAGWTDITGSGLSGGVTDQQVFKVFDKAGVKYLLGTNGANTLKKWDGTAGTYSDCGGTPPRARGILIINDRIVLLNLLTSFGAAVAGGSSYDCSAVRDFDSGWGATLSGILAETPGAIVAGVEMGSLRGAVYKTDAVYLFTASDGINPFTIELRQAGIEGPVAPNAIARLSDGLHVFLAQDGSLQQFDGASVSVLEPPIAPPSTVGPIQKFISKTIDFSNLAASWLAWDSRRRELHVVYPEVGSTDPNIDLIVSLPSFAIYPQRWATLRMTAGGWMRAPIGTTIGGLSGTIGDQTKQLGQYDTESRGMLFGDVAGQSFQDTGATDNGATIPHFMETGGADFNAPRNWKTLKEIDHNFDLPQSAQSLTVKIGTSDYGEPRTLDAGQQLALASGGPYVTGHRSTARKLSMRFEGNASQPIVWHGSNASVAFRGQR